MEIIAADTVENFVNVMIIVVIIPINKFVEVIFFSHNIHYNFMKNETYFGKLFLLSFAYGSKTSPTSPSYQTNPLSRGEVT